MKGAIHMKQYKVTLTTTELQKLTIFLVMYEDKLKDNAEMYEQESKEILAYSQETIEKFKSNAKWYRETYKVIHKIRENLDSIPF